MFPRARVQSAATVALSTALLLASAALPRAAFAQDSDEFAAVDHGQLSGPPMIAVVSLKEQRISVYDSALKAMRGRVSSGRTEYETPVGTYSILEKNKEHYSNVYDDAAMPFMQRITWSGVALHQGELPGYPASHGCVRLPMSFAEQLFPLTKIGMRVIVARDNVAPVPMSHPALFQPTPVDQSVVADRTSFEVTGTEKPGSVFEPNVAKWPQRQAQLDALRAVWLQKSAEASRLKADTEDAKAIAADRSRPQASALKTLKAIEKSKKAVDANIAKAEAALAAAKDPAKLKPFEVAKAKADAAVAAAQERVAQATALADAAMTDRARAKADRAVRNSEAVLAKAVKQADRAAASLAAAQLPQRWKKQEDAVARAKAAGEATARRYAAAEAAFAAADKELQAAKNQLDAATAAEQEAVAAATEAKRKTIPVSMFVSLKTNRVYVRQGHEPVADYPLDIAEPGKPIGTHVFTAIDYADNPDTLRWTAVSLNRRSSKEVAELAPKWKSKNRTDISEGGEPYPTDTAAAAAALDRVNIPQDVAARYAPSMWPGSSLIVSDEGLSKETNNATDFIVLISTEPQGGIKRRPKPKPAPAVQYLTSDGYVYYNSGYKNFGRPVIRIQPKKTFFDWW